MNNIFLTILVTIVLIVGAVGGWWFLIEQFNT
jgi:uncharacterized protein YneF (UPF0154 family)